MYNIHCMYIINIFLPITRDCINRNVLAVGTSGESLLGRRDRQDWNRRDLGTQYNWVSGFGQVTNSLFPFVSLFPKQSC